jgi:hypothetical protein
LMLLGDEEVSILLLGRFQRPKAKNRNNMDYINLPLSEHGRDYVSALLAAAILRAVMPTLWPKEVNNVLAILPERK